MFGIIISISIISGIMFYSDSTNESLVTASLSNVKLDISVEVGNIDLEEILDIQDYIDNELSALVLDSNLIAGTTPFFPILGGGMVSSDPNFEIEFGFGTNSNLNYSTTYIFGIQDDYLENQNLFDVGENVDLQLNTGEILLSQELKSTLDFGDIGSSVNISLAPEINIAQGFNRGSPPEVEIERTLFYDYVGEINFNNEVVQVSLDAFYEFDDDLASRFINIISGSANAIVMNYDDYFDLIGSNENLISFNSIHIILDRDGFSNEVDTLLIQLEQLTSLLETFYPSVSVNNFLSNALDDAYDELNSIKLALIYFALPGLFLGAYITKYAMDLNIKERKREINILRTKGATKNQIASIIIGESSIISLIGFLLGVALGYLLSFVTANYLSSDPGTISIQITQSSLLIITGIGISIAATAGYLSTKQLLDINIKSGMSTKTETTEFWRRYKIDFILLFVVGTIVLLNILAFNPVPDFASTLYSFLAPLFTWLGLTLLFMRFFTGALIKYSKGLTILFRKLYGDLSLIIVKNILFRNVKISNIIVLLSLTISFGLTLSIISDTYQNAAVEDAYFQVGSDIRIELPEVDFLDYNTSDMLTSLENQFSSEIEGVSAVITTQTNIGLQPATVIGVDPMTFFDVITIDDTYFVDSTVKEIKQSLLTFNENGDYNNVVFSSSLANPQTGDEGGGFGGRGGRQGGGGFGGDQNSDFLSVYSKGDQLPIFRFGNQTTVQISGIADFIPGISDFLGVDDSTATVMLVNEKFLTTPVTITDTTDQFTLLNQYNSSFALISTIDSVETAVLGQEILDWYTEAYPDSFGIDIITLDETLDEYSFKVGSIIGLTTMEWLLVLSITFLGLQIFLTSSLFERKKELSTYFAIGAKIKDIRNLIFGEVLLISVVSLVTGMLMSLVVSYMYLGFLSSLVILNIYQLSVPILSFVLMTILVLASATISIMRSISKLAKLDPAQTLRTV